jgi:dienelactone hydrolase
MEVYLEAPHGFFCDERPSHGDASAKDAWEKARAFFAQHLK